MAFKFKKLNLGSACSGSVFGRGGFRREMPECFYFFRLRGPANGTGVREGPGVSYLSSEMLIRKKKGF